MATQMQTYTDSAQEKVQGATTAVQDKAQSYASGLLGTIQGLASKITAWGQGLLDRFFPPEQRAELLAKLQAFMLANPKLSTFLGMNIALTGIPLALFVLFTITVAVFSLILGLLAGILGAVLFTLGCVGVALLIVLPTIFFTTMAACFFFLWGLGGYYILKWANGKSDDASSKRSDDSKGSIGDSLNALTGGRLTGFVDAAKAERAKGDITGFSDEYTKPKPPNDASQPNGSTQKRDQAAGNATSQTSNVPQAAKSTGVDSGAKSGANATSAVKGGVGGATGLT